MIMPCAPYRLRGHRVAYLSDEQIFNSVEAIIRRLGLASSSLLNNIEDLFDVWSIELGLTIDIVEDGEWLGFTNGHYDPTTLTIRIPERVLKSIKSRSKKQRREGLRVLFHELGHFSLAHKAVLHDSSGAMDCKEVDSEEQADLFADYMAYHIERIDSKQLCLF